jgi:hypothetical protein
MGCARQCPFESTQKTLSSKKNLLTSCSIVQPVNDSITRTMTGRPHPRSQSATHGHNTPVRVQSTVTVQSTALSTLLGSPSGSRRVASGSSRLAPVLLDLRRTRRSVRIPLETTETRRELRRSLRVRGHAGPLSSSFGSSAAWQSRKQPAGVQLVGQHRRSEARASRRRRSPPTQGRR